MRCPFSYAAKGETTMRIKTRETGTGTEYWDNIEKRTVFVPIFEEPDFKFKNREDVKSMLAEKQVEDTVPDGPIAMLPDMTVKELKQYAADNEIEIPEGIKKKDDIIVFLNEAMLAEGEEVEA